MYRFGDGTPFPLRENFIDTIVSAVDCCVALYRLEMHVEERDARQLEARRTAADELKRLDSLKALIETAVTPLIHKKAQRASDAAAARIYEAAQQILRHSRASVVKRRDTVIQDVPPPAQEDELLDALDRFFRSHALPRTEWFVKWCASADGKASVEIGAQATRELEVTFAAEASGDWTRPFAVSSLIPGHRVDTMVAVSSRPRSLHLDTYAVTEVNVAPGRIALVLRESGKKASAGLHVLMPHGPGSAPIVVALDKRDQPKSQPFHLDHAGTSGLLALWAAIEERLPELIGARGALTSARLGGREVSEIEHPSQLAEAILLALAPLLREMRVRSRVPGELILKRDLAGDRREEMFVPRKVLYAKLAGLPLPFRQVFEAVGLSDEATSDFMTRIGGKRPAPPMPRRPIAKGTASSVTLHDVQQAARDAAQAKTRPPAPPGARSPIPPRDDAFEREASDPLGPPLRPRPATNGPEFEVEATDAEATMPKERRTMVSGVIDAVDIGRRRPRALA
jgi:hypothetical protein